MPCPPPQICSLMKRLHIPRHTQVLSPPSFHSSSSLCLSLPPPENFYTSFLWGSENATSSRKPSTPISQPVRTFILKKKKRTFIFFLSLTAPPIPSEHCHSAPELQSTLQSTGYTSMAQPMYFTEKKKMAESSKKQNLNLPHASNYLHSIYIVLGIISNIEMIYYIWEDMCKSYANIMPVYIRYLSILWFWNPQGSWNQSPVDTEGCCIQ